MSEVTTGEEALHAKTDVTLEQLEELQAAGRAGVEFAEAIMNMGDDIDATDQQLIEQLRYAHSVGIDDAHMDKEIKEEFATKSGGETLPVKEERTYTEKETNNNAENFFDPVIPFIVKHQMDTHPINGQTIGTDVLQIEFEKMKKKIMNGDKDYLYTAILSQLGQMQQMSLKINGYMARESKVDTTLKYANMHVKLMAEQRRTIQALDDLMTPKKTTFVKEVSQHNHFSEKKDDEQNELSQPQNKEIIDAHQYTEAETITT